MGRLMGGGIGSSESRSTTHGRVMRMSDGSVSQLKKPHGVFHPLCSTGLRYLSYAF